MRLRARLEKLEQEPLEQPRPKSEYERRIEAAWALYAEPLAQTMSEAHGRILLDFLEGETDDPNGLALYRAFHSIMTRHWSEGAPLALPHAVGEAVLKKATFGAWDCEACGYSAPVMASRKDPRQDKPVAPACLLCGGRVGYFAYWLKHKRKPGVTKDPLLGPTHKRVR